jgi:hypothetical protein
MEKCFKEKRSVFIKKKMEKEKEKKKKTNLVKLKQEPGKKRHFDLL